MVMSSSGGAWDSSYPYGYPQQQQQQQQRRGQGCFLCNAYDHRAHDCRHRCIGCGHKPYHRADECTTPCYLCRHNPPHMREHHPFNCPDRCRCDETSLWHTKMRCKLKTRQPPTASSAPSRQQRSCLLCKSTDHQRNKCPDRCRSCKKGYTHLATSCRTVCNHCKQRGHSSSSCITTTTEYDGGDRDRDQETIISSILGRSDDEEEDGEYSDNDVVF